MYVCVHAGGLFPYPKGAPFTEAGFTLFVEDFLAGRLKPKSSQTEADASKAAAEAQEQVRYCVCMCVYMYIDTFLLACVY